MLFDAAKRNFGPKYGSRLVRLQFIGINYDPEMIGIGPYSTGLTEYLADAGHQVTVITAHPYYPEWRIRDGWPRWRWRREKNENGLPIIHCPLYVPRRPSALRRMVHYASFTLSALPVALWRSLVERPEVVFVVAPSLVSATLAWLVARLSGAKLWMHVQDFEVEAAFATGAISADSKIGRLAGAFERWIFTRPDMVSSISDPMLAKLGEKGVPADRIFELRNWANLGRVQVVEGESPLKAELGITTPHVALYSGNIAAKQGIEIIPQAARLLAHRKDLTFAIVGGGPLLEDLKARAEGLENVRFFPLQPIERLSEALGMATVHLLPQIGGVAELVLPSKLTNMLASGRPVVATALPDTALAREVEGAGVICPPGDPAALAAAIEALLDAPERRASLGAAARAGAVEKWDMKRILGRLERKLEELAGAGSSMAGKQ